MSELLSPTSLRDFSRGRIDKQVVNPMLVPLNSAANSLNVDFSEVIGSPIVRKGNRMVQQIMRFLTTDQFYTDNDASEPIYGANWSAQTFTPTLTRLTIMFNVRLKRVGTPAGNIILQIQSVTAGNPSGTVLAQTEFDSSIITTSGAGTGYEITFVPPTLTSGTTYSLVIKSPASIDASNCIFWFYNTAGGYAGGAAKASADSGATWGDFGTADFTFVQYIQNTASTWNEAPLGHMAGQIATTDVEVFSMVQGSNGKGIVYYWSAADNKYYVSLEVNLSGVVKQRYAILSGRIYLANGVDNMRSSVDFGKTWLATQAAGNITTDSVIPSLLWVSKNRMLAAGYSGFRSRVYFSSIVDPSGTPTINWNTDPTDGDWIDINPDDGGIITGFSDTSNLVLIFKDNAMYRLNTINKTVDSENIFNIGAVNQESIVKCLGVTYFYSGNGIYRTDGGFPEMISRLGCQDFIDAVRDSSKVYAGTDGLNVYFSLGTIILNEGTSDERQLNNVEIKFSPRDETWSIFFYSIRMGQHALFGDAPNDKLYVAQYNGDLGQLEYTGFTGSGTREDNTDYGNPIAYELETQEIEMGNRANTKVISDKVVVYTKDGANGVLQIKSNDDDFDPIEMALSDRVNVGVNINIEGNFFTFLWQGQAKGGRPILQGIYLPKVTDQGITKK